MKTYKVTYNQIGLRNTTGRTGRVFAGKNAARDSRSYELRLRRELEQSGYHELAGSVRRASV